MIHSVTETDNWDFQVQLGKLLLQEKCITHTKKRTLMFNTLKPVMIISLKSTDKLIL